jgi:hypothetical protein
VFWADGITTATGPTIDIADVYDGKWHYVVAYANNATKAQRVSVDGYWWATATGSGAYESEAAFPQYIGRKGGTAAYFPGAAAWVELSDNDRHNAVAGTDFPENLPVAPFNDVNTVEAWDMETGSGATAVAMVNTPTNDGTITSGTWEAVWNRELTPVEPVALEFFGLGENDGIDFGSGANIDDLPSADCTIEFCVRRADTGTTSYILGKSNAAGTAGWRIIIQSDGTARSVWRHATNNLVLESTTVITDDVLHHIAVDWDFGTLTGRLLVDGIEEDTDVAVGAYVVDAAEDCVVNGLGAVGTNDTAFVIGPIRLSDTRRYTTTNIVPPSMANWPGNDANAQLITTMRDGTGTTVTDYSGNGYNGTVTFGANTRWINSTDMEVVEPGAQMFHSGKVIGSDQALDGIKIQVEPTNPVDCVIIPRLSVGQDGRARIIIDYNGTQFKYPKFHGTHTGGAAIPCEDTDGAWSQHIKGWTLYNITQGTSGVPTAIDGDGQGVTGGPNFNNGDEYLWRPPNGDNYCQHPIGVYGIWVLRTAAAVVELQIVNGAGEGSIQVHQMEVQESLLDNGDMEAGAGNPWLPTGWATPGPMIAGESAQDAGTFHSGANSIYFLFARAGAYGISFDFSPPVVTNDYLAMGWWQYPIQSMTMDGTPYRQADPQTVYQKSNMPNVWNQESLVARAFSDSNIIRFRQRDVANAEGYIDDIYTIPLNPVSLTVTPASEANSLEGTGLRVDGVDGLTQLVPVGRLQPSIGHIRFRYTPRHDDSNSNDFGTLGGFAWIVALFPNANNNIDLFWNTANTLRLRFTADGAALQQADWLTGGGAIVAGAEYMIDIIYTPVWMRLYIDGILRITITAATGFVWPAPLTMNWLTNGSTIRQADAVIG